MEKSGRKELAEKAQHPLGLEPTASRSQDETSTAALQPRSTKANFFCCFADPSRREESQVSDIRPGTNDVTADPGRFYHMVGQSSRGSAQTTVFVTILPNDLLV